VFETIHYCILPISFSPFTIVCSLICSHNTTAVDKAALNTPQNKRLMVDTGSWQHSVGIVSDILNYLLKLKVGPLEDQVQQ
jgi:hypothetical protein